MTENRGTEKSGDSSGNQPRCPARNRHGQPCDAVPQPGKDFCIWHDPERAEDRRLWSIRGGRARSNESRARRQLGTTSTQLADLVPTLFAAIDDVREGNITPPVASAVASLARAVVTVSTASDIEARITALESALGLGRAS